MLTAQQVTRIKHLYGQYDVRDKSFYADILREIFSACDAQQRSELFNVFFDSVLEILRSDENDSSNVYKRHLCKTAITELGKISELLDPEQINTRFATLGPLHEYLTEPENCYIRPESSKTHIFRNLIQVFLPILNEEVLNQIVEYDISTLENIRDHENLAYETRQTASIFLSCHQMYLPSTLFTPIIRALAATRQIGETANATWIAHLSNTDQAQLLTHLLHKLRGNDSKNEELKAFSHEAIEMVEVHSIFKQHITKGNYAAANQILDCFAITSIFKTELSETISHEQAKQRALVLYNCFYENIRTDFRDDSYFDDETVYLKLILNLRILSEQTGAENSIPLQRILFEETPDNIRRDSQRRVGAVHKLKPQIIALHTLGYFSQEQIQRCLPQVLRLVTIYTSDMRDSLLKLWGSSYDKIKLIVEFENAMSKIANGGHEDKGFYVKLIEVLADFVPIEYLHMKMAQFYTYVSNNRHNAAHGKYCNLTLTLWDRIPELDTQIFSKAMRDGFAANIKYDDKFYPSESFVNALSLFKFLHSKLSQEERQAYVLKLMSFYPVFINIIQQRKGIALNCKSAFADWFSLAETVKSTINQHFLTISTDAQDKFIEDNLTALLTGFDTNQNYISCGIIPRYFDKNFSALQRYADRLLPKFLDIIQKDRRHTGGMIDCAWHPEDSVYDVATQLLTTLYPRLNLAQQQEVAQVQLDRSLNFWMTFTCRHVCYELLPTLVTEAHKSEMIEKLKRYTPSVQLLDYYQYLGLDPAIIKEYRDKLAQDRSNKDYGHYFLGDLTDQLLAIAGPAANRPESPNKRLKAGY